MNFIYLTSLRDSTNNHDDMSPLDQEAATGHWSSVMSCCCPHHRAHVGQTLQAALLLQVEQVEAQEHALLARVDEVLDVPDLGLGQLVLDDVVAVAAAPREVIAGGDTEWGGDVAIVGESFTKLMSQELLVQGSQADTTQKFLEILEFFHGSDFVLCPVKNKF